MSLMEMPLKELEKELQKFQLNDKEFETFKSGKEMIDKAMKLSEEESTRAGSALLVYMIYKAKEKFSKQ